MNRRRTVGILCFLLAIAFAANALWLYPHADEPRYEYRADELSDGNRHQYLQHHPKVKECYIVFSRACGLEHQARDEPLRLNLNETDASDYLDDTYRFVVFSDGYRKPTQHNENGSLVLSSKPVSEQAVAAELATSYEHIHSQIRRVFDSGTTTTRNELPRNYLLQRNGSVYVIDKIGESHPNYGFKLVVLRGLLWLTTIPLSVASFIYWYG
ncbi:hypothetical protein [Haladaptatus sp. DFWS20]|uniref:hypothetical protein n=1 Tax=Haladaptatus sp. DFWS20 TaxID=3403467 RepID=UPI003EBA1F1B